MFTNDTFQGREDAKFVPISDQWGASPTLPLRDQRSRRQDFKYDVPPPPPDPKVKKSHKPENYHRKNVMTDSNGRGVSTEIVEDIFHSFEAWNDHPNPHNARMVSGKYYFDYPASWLNANTVARAISLRSITVTPPALHFSMDLLFVMPEGEGPPPEPLHVRIFLSIPSKYSIDQALSTISKTVNKVLPSTFPSKLCYGWNCEKNTASLFLRENDGSDPTGHMMIEAAQPQFKWLFNIAEADIDTVLAQMDEWVFPEVWDRKKIFVHASFVNNAAFHYLGTDGEFYTTPSKIYHQNFTGNDFEVYLSTDGVRPIDIPYQDFSIELSLLIDRKHYQE
jgi:hypothetical protein